MCFWHFNFSRKKVTASGTNGRTITYLELSAGHGVECFRNHFICDQGKLTQVMTVPSCLGVACMQWNRLSPCSHGFCEQDLRTQLTFSCSLTYLLLVESPNWHPGRIIPQPTCSTLTENGSILGRSGAVVGGTIQKII